MKAFKCTFDIILMLLTSSFYVSATEYRVFSVDTLETTLSELELGDSIIMDPNGNWHDKEININVSGTADSRITISGGGQLIPISGTSVITVNGSFIDLSDFKFSGETSTSTGVIHIHGDEVSLTDSVFDGIEGEGKWLSISGRFANISHNVFENKNTKGQILTVWRPDSSPNFTKITANHFKNFADGRGENGWEAIRIGTSHTSLSGSYSTVSGNLFESMNGEIELISLKSGHNKVRNNTVIGSKGLITSRHGNYNEFSDNIILANGVKHAGGFRLYGSHHVVKNNYIQGIRTTSNTRGGIVIHSGTNSPSDHSIPLSSKWTANNITIEDNTIIDSEQSILFDNKYSFSPENIVLENNVIIALSGKETIRIDSIPINSWWIGGVYEGVDARYIDEINMVPTPSDESMFYSTMDGLLLHQHIGAHDLTRLYPSDVGRRSE